MMDNLAKHYLALGLQRGATQEEIHAAFQRMEELYHPDRDASLFAQMRYREACLAYDALRKTTGTQVPKPPNPVAGAQQAIRDNNFTDTSAGSDKSTVDDDIEDTLLADLKKIDRSFRLLKFKMLAIGLVVVCFILFGIATIWSDLRDIYERMITWKFTSTEGNFSVEFPSLKWRQQAARGATIDLGGGNIYLIVQHEDYHLYRGGSIARATRGRALRGYANMIVTIDRHTPAMLELRKEMSAQWDGWREIWAQGGELLLNNILIISDGDSLASIGFPMADIALTRLNTRTRRVRIGNHEWTRLWVTIGHRYFVFWQTAGDYRSTLYTVAIAASGNTSYYFYRLSLMRYRQDLEDIMNTFSILP